MTEHGLFTRDEYRNARFDNLHAKASPEIQRLVKKFSLTTKDTLYKKKLNFFIFGNHRIGKTWFLHALANHLIVKFNERSLYYATCPKLYEYFKKHSKRKDSTWVTFLASVRFLFLDDLGLEYRGAASGFAETYIENFVRFRFNSGRVTILSSNAGVDSLYDIYGKSFAKFIEGEFVVIELPSDVNMSQVILHEKLRS